MSLRKYAAAALISVTTCGVASADFMNIITLAPGGAGVGSWTGFLDGVPLLGSYTVGPGSFINADPGPFIGGSTIGDTSPQHSYPGIYFPLKALSDKVGFSSVGAATSHINIRFAAPVKDPVFHVANLDVSALDFSSTAGLGPMILLAGNGGGGDGLTVAGPVIMDMSPFTIDLTPDTGVPPVAGDRSAYGSVWILGTYLTLDFDIITPPGVIENATFTLSSVPEPSTIILGALAGMGVIGGLWYRRRENQMRMDSLCEVQEGD